MRILCPVTDRPVNIPGHQLFGSSYFKDVWRAGTRPAPTENAYSGNSQSLSTLHKLLTFDNPKRACDCAHLTGVFNFQHSTNEVEVEYLVYKQGGYGLLRTLWLNLTLALRIMLTKHDVLYFRIDPDPLLLLSLLKTMGIYRHPIYAWKYTSVDRTGNRLKDWVKRILHRGFTKIFMVTESHVPKTIAEGILRPDQVEYVKWGEDLSYVDRFKADKHKEFTFITTGKAHRDMRTLCEAFIKASKLCSTPMRLKIFTVRRWANYDYEEYLEDVVGTIATADFYWKLAFARPQSCEQAKAEPNLCEPCLVGAGPTNSNVTDHVNHVWTGRRPAPIDVIFSDEIRLEEGCNTVLDQLFREMHRSHCALSICHSVKFGVGYTQVLDSLACGIPIIATANPDNPIDIDKEHCGVTVEAGNVDALADVMIRMVSDTKLCHTMGRNGRSLIEKDYDIRQTAQRVSEEIGLQCAR